ncbi:MAG: ABC transporter permease [Thermoanaerobaculia bacterium]|nr:ABC transporter permease [Thermoanaerobaculia bacterium]
MSFWRAILYFLDEALSGLARAWKSSLLAVLTIAVSLFVLGAFLIVGRNTGEALETWRSQARVIVYLEPGTDETRKRELRREIEGESWVIAVRSVSEDEARRRFRDAFPSLAELMEGWRESPLPPSLEVSVEPAAPADGVDRWVAELAERPEVELVDDDRDWLLELESMAAAVGAVGWGMSVVLLTAAAFTIGSVIRLAASMYRDEIAIMRMVGATEFLIRGPFYAEGLLQGAVGAVVATAWLWLLHLALVGRSVVEGVVVELLLERFLSPGQVILLVAVGALAGTVGAVVSLRGEALAPRDD